MKKAIIVLLITVLVAGFAFAGTFKGSAGIEFDVLLNTQEWGFKNTTTGKYTFKFEFDSTKVSIGDDHQTDVWAELAADASAWISLSNAPLASNANVGGKYTARITKANIHVGEITFGILNAGKTIDLASSYYDDDENGKPDYDVLGGNAFLANGFTVNYKDWNGGFGAQGTWGDNPAGDTYQIFAHVETPTFKFADDQVSVLGGAYAFVTDKDNTNATQFGGAAKAAYEADKISADVEADVAYIGAAEKFVFEAAANATYNFGETGYVGLNVYSTPYALLPIVGAPEDAIKLDAMLSAGYVFGLSDDIDLSVDAWAEVRDALIDGLSLEAGAVESTTIDAFTIALTEIVDMWNLANDNPTETMLTLREKVTYKHEKFEAYEQLTVILGFGDGTDDPILSMPFECGISTTEIVEGATLALTYKNADFKFFNDGVYGNIVASCTITF